MIKFILFCLLVGKVLSAVTPRKCLFPNFQANHTTDGLENCVCTPGTEYDENFGICFENKCKLFCGEMNCQIQKSNIVNFNYFCFCDPGSIPITEHANVGCIPFETTSGFSDTIKNLPKNPFILKHLGCSGVGQTYQIVDDKYECSCLPGYSLRQDRTECVPTKNCPKICNKNQVCTFDGLDQSYCACKTGFFGENCSDHFCNHKNATLKERTFLDLSIKNVCGYDKCSLENDEFKCACGFDMDQSENGLCEIKKPCLPGAYGHEKCGKENRFCMIKTDNWGEKFQCLPSLEQGNKQAYEAKFTKPNNITYKLSMKARLSWWDGQFFIIFLNQGNNLRNSGIQKKFPGYLFKEFIDYEQKIFWSLEEYEFYEPQLQDKLRNAFWKGMKTFHPIRDYCGNHSIYPEFTYDVESFKMNRLVETVFDVDYLIYCEHRLNKTGDEILKIFTNDHLLQNKYENYYFMRETGWIYPNSIRLEVSGETNEENDTGNEEEKFNKCLRPYQHTKFSMDGLTNCTCMDGYEFDQMFGVCFKNKCKEICGEMSCFIVKHDFDHFEYQCYCEFGFQRIDPYYPAGCVATQSKFSNLIKSSEKAFPLPLSPFLLNKLACDHSYEFDSKNGTYKCTCFEGWKLDLITNKCLKIDGLLAHNRPNHCNSNQVFAVLGDSLGMRGICKCKAGFGGPECLHNICAFPPVSHEAATYIHNSIEQFCGMPNCELAFDEFFCKCSEPFYRNKKGECVLHEHCTKEENYGECGGQNKFCKILTNDLLRRPSKCQCPIEEGGNRSDHCFEYRIDDEKYCLPGYVINDRPNREFPQRCVKGDSTFNMTMKLRFDLTAGNNSNILLNDYYDLKDSISFSRVPVKLLDQFLDYRARSLHYSINKVLNKVIIKDKLEDILRNAITKSDLNVSCHLINVVPSVEFDESQLNLFKLLESVIDANIAITCRNQVSAQTFLDAFQHYLKMKKSEKTNRNYHHFPKVGFVRSESLRIRK